MDERLLKLLVCPMCKGPLEYHEKDNLLICTNHELAFPVRNGIPILIESEAFKTVPDDNNQG